MGTFSDIIMGLLMALIISIGVVTTTPATITAAFAQIIPQNATTTTNTTTTH